MRIWRAALAAVFAFACLPAFAAPPPNMWEGSFRVPAVVCNSIDEVRSVFDAGNAKPDGGGASSLWRAEGDARS